MVSVCCLVKCFFIQLFAQGSWGIQSPREVSPLPILLFVWRHCAFYLRPNGCSEGFCVVSAQAQILQSTSDGLEYLQARGFQAFAVRDAALCLQAQIWQKVILFQHCIIPSSSSRAAATKPFAEQASSCEHLCEYSFGFASAGEQHISDAGLLRCSRPVVPPIVCKAGFSIVAES